jgi:hypothetical protein
MENDKLFGKLFDSIPLNNEEHLEAILASMNKETATYFIVQAVKYAYHNGLYSIGEAEVISKAIRILSKNEKTEE